MSSAQHKNLAVHRLSTSEIEKAYGPFRFASFNIATLGHQKPTFQEPKK